MNILNIINIIKYKFKTDGMMRFREFFCGYLYICMSCSTLVGLSLFNCGRQWNMVSLLN